MCDNHHPVPTRRLHFKMIEDSSQRAPGHIIRAIEHSSHAQIVEGHTDGLGCPACGSFEPTGAYVARSA